MVACKCHETKVPLQLLSGRYRVSIVGGHRRKRKAGRKRSKKGRKGGGFLLELLLQTGPKACLIDTVNLYREVV